MSTNFSKHRFPLAVLAITTVCLMVAFYEKGDDANIFNAQRGEQSSNAKNITGASFPWDRATEASILSEHINNLDMTNDTSKEDDSLDSIYARFASGETLKAIRDLEFKLTDAKTNEVDAIKIAEDLANMASNDSRLIWVTAQLEKRLSVQNPNEAQKTEAYVNACGVIAYSINPSQKPELAIAYASHCVSEQPNSSTLKYNLALVSSTTGDNTGAITILNTLPEKTDESLFLLAQLYQRNGNIPEATKYADMLREKNSQLATYLEEIPSNI
jgi:predicted Zn-dependent protease